MFSRVLTVKALIVVLLAVVMVEPTSLALASSGTISSGLPGAVGSTYKSNAVFCTIASSGPGQVCKSPREGRLSANSLYKHYRAINPPDPYIILP